MELAVRQAAFAPFLAQRGEPLGDEDEGDEVLGERGEGFFECHFVPCEDDASGRALGRMGVGGPDGTACGAHETG